MSFFFRLNTNEDILNNVGNQTVDVNIVFNRIFFVYTMVIVWKSMATVNCLVTNIPQNIFF